jgi:hypothetical protein
MIMRDCVIFETGKDSVTHNVAEQSQSAERRTAHIVSAAPIGSQGNMEIMTIYN